MRIALAVLALALAAVPAEAKRVVHGIDCDKTTILYEEDICTSDAFREADERLNAAFAEALKGQDTRGRALLRASERLWVQFRDAQCDYELHQGELGQKHPVYRVACMIALTDLRTRQIEDSSQ